MVPEIQLMMRVERNAETQRRPNPEDRSDYSIFELIRAPRQLRRLTHAVSRFAVGNQPMKVHNQGALQCNCAH